MKRIISLIFLMILSPVESWASGERGNGGVGVKCDEKIYTLDYFEVYQRK